jgi:hypothetical protein
MSEPKRYNFSATIVHHIDGETTAALKYHTEPDGLFVSYEDYARLKAEVERLTKAGDDLAFLACFHYDHGDISKDKHSVAILDAWDAAKEGKAK